MTDSRADKIAALLAKAERTDNEHERETFSAAAERLMLKWGVDEAMASAAAAGKAGPVAKMTTKFLVWGAEYQVAWHQLASWMKMGLGNVVIVNHGPTRISVLGTEGDVTRFVQLFVSLKAQASRAMNVWWKTAKDGLWDTGRQAAWKHRRQFLISFAGAVGHRLMAEYKEAVEETAGSALVLVDQKAAVELYVTEQFPELRKGRNSSYQGGGSDARQAGRAAGQRASFGSQAALR